MQIFHGSKNWVWQLIIFMTIMTHQTIIIFIITKSEYSNLIG